jgi:DNA-binding transcriptional regulator GbsR (MarR family)
MTTATPPIERFIERLGLATEAEGLPRTAGRLMAYLLVTPGPCTFEELMEALQISRGGVSTNTRLLESLGIIERITKPGDRRDHYQIAPDPYGQLIQGQLQRMRKTEAIVAECRQALPKGGENGRHRLVEMDRFYRYAIAETERFLKGWRAEREK